MKRWIILALQTLVTVGLFAWFFHKPEFREQAVKAITTASPLWLLAGFAIAGVENFLGVLRWYVFLRLLKIDLPFRKIVRIYYLGLFLNVFLFGVIGGDIIKVAYLVQKGYRTSHALLSVVMDRISGLGALLLATAIFTTLRYNWLMQSPVVGSMLHFVYLYLGVITVLLALSFVGARHGALGNLPRWAPLRDRVIELGQTYYSFIGAWRRAFVAVGISILMVALYFAVFYCAVRAYNAGVTFIDLAAIMPAIDVISALPISIGGMGVREQLFVLTLGSLCGVAEGVAASISMTGFLLASSWGLAGVATLPLYKGLASIARKEISRARV
jgi:uncharacterized membrane protein YbhN (UPF0104 family)